jgi:hypothetical protein
VGVEIVGVIFFSSLLCSSYTSLRFAQACDGNCEFSMEFARSMRDSDSDVTQPHGVRIEKNKKKIIHLCRNLRRCIKISAYPQVGSRNIYLVCTSSQHWTVHTVHHYPLLY